MAVFNIQVELDWIDDEGSIDSEIQKQVIKGVTTKIYEKLLAEKQAAMSAQVSDQVDALVNAEFETLLSQPVVQTDKYGDVKKSFPSIREMIKSRFDGYISEEVDSKTGAKWTSGYGSGNRVTRFEYIMGKAFGTELEKKMDDLRKKVEKDTATATDAMFTKMQEILENSVKSELGEKVAELIKLDEILKIGSGKKKS